MSMKKILVVVDMQNDFVDGSLGTAEAIKIVPNVCKKIKEFDGKIFVTMDTHYDNYLETQEGKNLPVDHCIKESIGWNINSNVKKALENKDFKIIEKESFGSLDLPNEIKKYQDVCSEIELIGLCTDICVVSNALILKAAFPEIKISVDSSCCAGVTVESHNAALKTMQMCQIKVCPQGTP